MDKSCIKCEEVKSFEEFTRNHTAKGGRGNVCKVCINKRQNEARKRNGRNVGVRRPKGTFINASERHFFYKYGLSNKEVFQMFKEQLGKCKICNCETTDKRNLGNGWLVVDHCHVTGKVRGLLCSSCNVGLGFLNDDKDIMRNAISYLE